MMRRTHLAVGIGAALYFLPHVVHKALFIPIVLIATLIPDIDSRTSTAGKSKVFRPVQAVSDHRGIVHSYTIAVIGSILLAFIFPIAALPFFVGYSFHLLMDSFTPEGIRPFWPIKKRSAGIIKTGGQIENAIFAVVVFVDIALLVKLFL